MTEAEATQKVPTSESASKSAAGEAPEGGWRRFVVPVVFVAFVVMQAGNRVLMKRTSSLMHSATYNLVMWNLLYTLCLPICNLVFCLLYIGYKRSQGDASMGWRWLLPNNKMACAGAVVPLYQFALLSGGDQLMAALSGPPMAFISQTMQSVMINSQLLWIAALSYFALGTRYKQVHLVGCLMVIVSMLVGVSTKLSANDCSPEGMRREACLYSYMGTDGEYHELSAKETMLWYGMYLLSVLPGCFSWVYKEYIMRDKDVDVIYAQWWSGNTMVFWGLLCLPMVWIKLPGQDLSPGQTWGAIQDTWSCLQGNVPHPGDESCAASPPPIFWFFGYLFFNMSYNILLLWLTKHLSAAWATIATVLCLDLANYFSTIPLLAGGSAESMSLNDWLATIQASLALWVYAMEPEIQANPSPVQKEITRRSTLRKQDEIDRVVTSKSRHKTE